jgi:hypothetical protein
MKRALLVVTLACSAFAFGETAAQVPALPDGARTHWVVDQPEEIVTYLTFDPASVEREIPPSLRFITVKELAAGGVRWATDYLTEHPSHGPWGISFFEIVRMKTFEIDGRAPAWPEHGATALWCVRVAPSDSTRDLGPGRPFLALEFWMPDSAYVAYMREKGHYATYADVRLRRDPEGGWRGTVNGDGLNVIAECVPTGPITGGAGSAGMQVFLPPLSSTVTDVVRFAFAGHREQECSEDSSWRFDGTHPLASAVVVGRSIFEFGYDLTGGAYTK